ncbi:MAG: hypothetical protein K2N89_07410, partial [Lachnospiraceae bacterium]|nr:hypothetical protein [Lachnospiraceae bacterium]
ILAILLAVISIFFEVFFILFNLRKKLHDKEKEPDINNIPICEIYQNSVNIMNNNSLFQDGKQEQDTEAMFSMDEVVKSILKIAAESEEIKHLLSSSSSENTNNIDDEKKILTENLMKKNKENINLDYRMKDYEELFRQKRDMLAFIKKINENSYDQYERVEQIYAEIVKTVHMLHETFSIEPERSVTSIELAFQEKYPTKQDEDENLYDGID